MGDNTGISWADATWNPTVGCTKISAGCTNCYAFKLHEKRHRAWKDGWDKAPPQYHKPFSELQVMDDRRLTDPLRWKKHRRIFVNSVSDLFHEDLEEFAIAKVFGVMAVAQSHRFMVFTKRPERMRDFLKATWPTPLPNVMLGVSVEDQETADERVPILLDTPAIRRAVSYEPALERVDFTGFMGWDEFSAGEAKLDWIIVGGESGPGARPFHREWAQRVVDDCFLAKVACHVKQMGSNPYKGNEPWNLPGKGGDMMAWPPALRVRQWPDEG
jgi:protein gp37